MFHIKKVGNDSTKLNHIQHFEKKKAIVVFY